MATDRNIVKRFDSWGEWIDYCNGPTDCRSGRNSREPDRGRNPWHGSETFDKAITLAESGWADKRSAVMDLTGDVIEDLKPHMQSSFEFYYDVSGGLVDIDRYLVGEPECMMEIAPIHVAKPGRVITILVNMAVSVGIKPEAIVRRGVAIAGLIECMAAMQHGSELWIEFPLRGNSGRVVSHLVKVKGTDESLDVDRMLFAVAHPASFRRLDFSAMERLTANERREFSCGDGGGSYSMPVKTITGDDVGATVTIEHIELGTDPETWIRDYLGEWGLLTDE